MLMYSAHVLIVFGSCEFLENKKSGTNNKTRGQNYILVFDIHICNNIPLSCSTARPRGKVLKGSRGFRNAGKVLEMQERF